MIATDCDFDAFFFALSPHQLSMVRICQVLQHPFSSSLSFYDRFSVTIYYRSHYYKVYTLELDGESGRDKGTRHAPQDAVAWEGSEGLNEWWWGS
jgi:hypothetical protein